MTADMITVDWHFTLDWHDAYTAGVSILLLASFRLAVRARDVAATNSRRSQRLMLWSGALLFIGHGCFFVIGTMLSLEGFYLVNAGFMLNGIQVAVRMAKALRSHPASGPTDDTPPEPPPSSRTTNGHQLPIQRPAPTGSGPWPRPQRPPDVAALVAETTRTESLTPPTPDRVNATRQP